MKRISRRNFLKAMGISTTALALAACGGSSSSTAAGTAGSSAASAAATGEPKAGGTLRLCYGNPIATPGYTPRATGNALLFYLNLAYENLLTYDNDGNMVPKLATEWDVNNDENSITWTLRENVKFADGEPFNAEAVKRNIEEYQANNRTETANIAECQIIDDTHIKMMMAEPNSSTLESVGFFVYYMSPKALENPSSLDAATCGTGPFQLSEFENNAYAIYTKNENYWKEGLPYLDSVEITVVTESSTAETAFRANEYDMLQVLDMSPLVKQDLDNDGIYVAERNENGMGVGTLGLIPNSAIDGPWADARVRRAMCYAIDVDALNAAFLMGTAQMTDQWAVPGAVTYNDDINHYKFDPDRAKELLAEAGYADGFNTNIVTVSTISDMFTAIANMLDEVGIHCNIQQVDGATQNQMYMDGTWEGLMPQMIGKRVVQSCITILLVTLFVFALIQMVPGDPVANYLGATATEEQITYYRHLYGFDRPVIVQYLSWIGGLFRGTMGQSISYQSEIADIILPRLGTTLTMVIPAFIIGTITGILFGIIAAKNRGKVIDSVISFFANIGVSMPMFWLGMMGMLVFALKLRVLPSSGYVPITRDFGGWLSHMIMPIIVLSLGVNAGFVRLTRSSMLEVMRQDYVTTARAKGVSKKDVTFRHQLRNSMIPIVTTMGMRLGSMVGSTVLIESLFVIPGLGSVMMNGISNRDFMLVANGVLIISIFVAICNLVVDILYGIIDPRTR